MRFLQIPDIRDNYKVVVSFLAFLFIFSVVRAQDNSNIIQYYFGPTVDTIFNIAIDSSVIKLGTDESFLISCSNDDTVVYIGLYKYCSSCPVFDSTGDIDYWRGYLAMHTNRFYILKNKRIPVIFDEFDECFGALKVFDREKGGFVKAFRLLGEFEANVCIRTNWRGDKIYKVTYIYRE